MRLVVHIGAPRAATGFLQRCLSLNEEPLRRRGVYLPATGRFEAPYDTVAHHNLGWQLLKDPSFDESKGTWAGLTTELEGVEADTVVLASETFGHLAAESRCRKELQASLTALSDEVTVVYTARDPLERINAMFLQTVRALGEPFSFDEYAHTAVRGGCFDVYETLRYWLEADNVSFVGLRFDEMQENGPLETFLGVLGVTLPPRTITVPEDDKRGAPGAIAVEALRALNVNLRVTDPSFSRKTPAAIRLAQGAERRAAKLGWYDEPFWGWDRAQAEWALGRLKAGNDAFAQAVWGTDWPLASPTDREQRTLNLIEADRKVYNDSLTFIGNLTQRYLKLAKDPGEDEAEADLVDPSSVIADEAERSAPASARRIPASRAS